MLIKATLIKKIVLVLLLINASNVWSEVSTDDIAEALSAFTRATVVNQTSTSVVDYSVALGEIKKARGLWAPERERRLDGELTKTTWLIPEGHSPQSIFDYYQRRLNNLNARVLFSCEARNCGLSNAWANEQFKVKELYGLDGEQSYAAYEIADSRELLHYVMLYTVIRGNRRVYAHTEWLQTSSRVSESLAPSAAEVDSHFHNRGYYQVSGLSLDGDKLLIDDEHLSALVEAMRNNRRMNFRLVGHQYGNATLDQQMTLSQQRAQQLQQVLVERGIVAARLSSHGVGSLAPGGRQQAQANNNDNDWRIEVVVVKP